MSKTPALVRRSGAEQSAPAGLSLAGVIAYSPFRISIHDPEARAKLDAFAAVNGIDTSTAAELLLCRGFDACATPTERARAKERLSELREQRTSADQERERRERILAAYSGKGDRRAEMRRDIVALFERLDDGESLSFLDIVHAVRGNSATKGELLHDLEAEGLIERIGKRGNKGYRATKALLDLDTDDEPNEPTTWDLVRRHL